MAKPYDPKDFYYRKAKAQGLRARSAFKIDEILKRHRLLGPGQAVLDLGAAPGGFLQVLAEQVGERGVAVGVDLEPIRNLGKAWVRTAIVDLLAPDALEKIRALHDGRFDLVASDMAPKTIGVKVTDEARSLELVRMALAVAEATLRRGGAFVAKVFVGGEFPALQKELRERFDEVHVVRPRATRTTRAGARPSRGRHAPGGSAKRQFAIRDHLRCRELATCRLAFSTGHAAPPRRRSRSGPHPCYAGSQRDFALWARARPSIVRSSRA